MGVNCSGSKPDDSKMYINRGQDDEMEIFYYRTSQVRTALTYLGFVLTCGILRLVYHWIPHLYLFSTSVSCGIEEAEKILILELYNGKHKIYHVKPLKVLTPESVAKMEQDDDVLHQNNSAEVMVPQSLSVHFEKGDFREVDRLLMFSVKKVTYLYDNDKQEFVKLAGLDSGVACDVFHQYRALTTSENFMRRLVYGPNLILVKESSIATLLFLEVLNPFYIFQMFSFILWFSDQYYYYAAAILAMSVFGITMTVRQTRKNQRNLKSTVHSSDVCTVLRRSPKAADYDELNDHGYTSEIVSTDLLVPGDILEIPSHGCIMHCDAILLTGNCILNEAMLTGESVPITKTALPNFSNLIYDPKEHGRHTLFCGTHVIQTRYFGNEKVLAVVIRTGFSTAKGSLVRSILYPPPVDFRFEKDSYKFVAFLALIAGIGFMYTVVTKIVKGVSARDIILQALDLITIVVPPALPAAMTVGRFYAQIRLKNNNIFCISPRSINVSGGINCVCFDKTGTLTEDGLDLLCVVPAKEKSFSEPITNVDSMPYDTFLYGLVCCHSLTIIDHQIVGDPLDLKMYESTKWVMDESMSDVAENNKFDVIYPTVLKPPKNRAFCNQNFTEEPQIGILREFPFSSSSQRMGVIIRRLNGHHFEYYCKGSPEMILNFVKPETIPQDFHDILESYTQEGYRVIAMAHKELKMSYAKVQKVQRDALEKDLNFLGLIVLENRLKPETYPCIQALNEAAIRVIMVTGDNILTAISVAKDCDIVLTEQSIITVNSDSNNPPSLYYTLANTKDRAKAIKDLSIMSNSASVVSLETLESQLQTNSVNTVKDCNIENGTVTPVGLLNNYRFAMTGKTWGVVKEYYPELLPRICTRGSVFARMSPEQKQQLVQELQGLGYCVAMCGDGANDCGALKAAHTGISLSEAESSVASPFTSRNPNITCVLDVIREGRAALVTSFGIFKYMAGYSLCQFVSVLILYSIESNLTDMEYLYIDLAIISIFAFFFGKTEAYPGKLHKNTPLTSLISLSPVLSLLIHMVLVVIFQVAAFEHLKAEPWYVPFNNTDPEKVACVENYAIYTVSSFQYIILAIVFSKGYPYRKSIFSNYGFIISSVVMTAISVYLALYPAEEIQHYMELKVPEDWNFRLYLLAYAAANFAASMLIEHYFIEKLIFKRLRYKFHNVDKSKKKYLAIERDLNRDTKWPVLTSDFKSAASPLSPAPECHAEIVVEKENKFDKNHVLNKLYDCNNSNNNSTFATPVHQYSTPNNYSKSETYKSVSQSSYDMASSQLNIPDIPYDDPAPLGNDPINISVTSESVVDFQNNSPKNNYSQFNAFGISKSPPEGKNEENLRLELNNFDINR
ncbi:polyamine-transporting ATPase 13A3 isoform X2 [Anthonomus grandis grandis]|uniref:polyamine-transporting ATPase 13A3 isoform X2 n=1 Tax=Anthonomus grandis grandis TaxID=2921223 RepID=UPI0021652FE6|nr:polyamine-transporting ATPase 13A3 isoform X2 [Anthonomus grandis grandis]